MESISSSTEDEDSRSEDSSKRIRELELRVAELEKRLEERQLIPEGLLSPEQVKEYLGVSDRTVDRLVDRGFLSPIWIGGQRRFELEAVRGYLREHGTSKQKLTKETV
jgi:excisionase family DNA binding protein